MEQTVGELIAILSRYDCNTRIFSGNAIEFKYNSSACRLEVKKLEGELDDTKISKLRSSLQNIRGNVEMIALDARSIMDELCDLDEELSELQ